MKVTSPLANMEIGIGEIRRRGHQLIVRSEAGGSMDAEICLSATEVVRTIGRVLSSPSALGFILGLPYFWWREKRGGHAEGGAASAVRRPDINKPW